MPAITTDYFRIANAKKEIQYVGSNNAYLTIGNISSWSLRGSSDSVPPTPFSSTNEIQRFAWDSMIAAKKIVSGDMSLGIKRYNWTSGSTYDVYSSTDTSLFLKPFYVITDEFKVYKLLSKPGTGNVSSKPTATTAAVISGADGYTWKYMYTLSATEILRFLTPNFIPVPSTLFSSNTATFGAATDNPVSVDGTVGHGYDPARELGAYYFLLNMKFEQDELTTFSTKNDYRTLSIVVNPLTFSNANATAARYRQTTRLDLSTPPAVPYVADETVTASNGATGTVVEFSGSSIFVIQTSTTNFATGSTVTAPSQSGATRSVATINNQGLKRYSGDTTFVEYRRPIVRSDDQSESVTIVLEF